ncbi:hypothetical protein MJO28_009084 [Puccinia striiformis f. sp. tritici]|uniref:Uncharacterized protein n=2 Tax=Puccinia striiformis TaxID=27350 RepID=A0A2S4VM06_9BASI|nr:hypothetical protein MJO28_009084 [Puccinia striiformis f. sp. tritici]KAI7950499.1 hypothetical protein MJO29_009173 [Puccinia striiformis f. sp. tritici]POW10509.1 hypothetical protein PSHT_08733 [Puccinia striiformis]
MVFGKGRPNRLVLGDSAGDSQCATIVAPDEIVDAEVPVATNVALEPEIGDDNRKLGPPSGPLSPAFELVLFRKPNQMINAKTNDVLPPPRNHDLVETCNLDVIRIGHLIHSLHIQNPFRSS